MSVRQMGVRDVNIETAIERIKELTDGDAYSVIEYGTQCDQFEVIEAAILLAAEAESYREIVKAVANIGADFGYGEYALEQKHIDDARKIFGAAPDNDRG